MKLLDDWKLILRRAWSLRLWALAALFEGAGVVLPLFIGDVPRNIFAILSLIAAVGGMWARLVEQRGLRK